MARNVTGIKRSHGKHAGLNLQHSPGLHQMLLHPLRQLNAQNRQCEG